MQQISQEYQKIYNIQFKVIQKIKYIKFNACQLTNWTITKNKETIMWIIIFKKYRSYIKTNNRRKRMEKQKKKKLLQCKDVDRLQGQGQDRVKILQQYQSTMDKGLGDRHVTWKSCDRVQSGLEGLRVQKDREEFRWNQGQEMMSRDKSSSWCTHGVHMYSRD